MGWRTTALALALSLFLLPQGAWADSATWVGTTTNYNLTTNWQVLGVPPANVPGDGGAGQTGTFTDTGAGAVNIGTATTNSVGFRFSDTTGHDYTVTVADGQTQVLSALTTTGSGNVTLATNGTGAYDLTSIQVTLATGQTTTISGTIHNTAVFQNPAAAP